MSIAGLLILLVVVGVAMYFLPLDARVKQVIVAVVAIVAIVWLFRALGVL